MKWVEKFLTHTTLFLLSRHGEVRRPITSFLGDIVIVDEKRNEIGKFDDKENPYE